MSKLSPKLALPVLAAALAVCAAIPASVGASTRSNPNPATFTEPTGDSGTAADITSVVVSNDSKGQITFQVNFAAAPTSTDTVDVLVDSDANPSTGDTGAAGAEYDLQADIGSNSAGLGFWNGTPWTAAPSQATFSASQGSAQVTFSVNRSDLGNTSSFNFWVDSSDGQGGAGHEDQAPDQSTWSYQLASSLQLSVVLSGGSGARAGGTYTAVMLVRRSDTGDFLGSEATLTCTGTLGSRRIAGHGLFASITEKGTKVTGAVCAYRLPKTAGGKTLHATITVAYEGVQAVHRFTVHVRKARR
jgi:hypothetical protein